MSSESGEDDVGEDCPICHEGSTNDYKVMWQHFSWHHSGRSMEEFPQLKELKREKVACPKCERTIVKDNLHRHTDVCRGATSKSDSSVECPVCHHPCSDRKQLGQHMKRHHPGRSMEEFPQLRNARSAQAQCPICGSMKSKANIKRHTESCKKGGVGGQTREPAEGIGKLAN